MKLVIITEKPAKNEQDRSKQQNIVYEMPDIPEMSDGDLTFIKNSPRDNNGHLVRGENCDPYEAVKTIDGSNGIYAFCLDAGALNVCGQDPREFIRILGNRIKAVIIRDNDGHNDKALMPFSCILDGGPVTDHKGVILGLREIDFDGLLILDCSDSVAALQPGIKKDFLPYAQKMGEYFKWQIGIDCMVRSYDKCVLFGAGRMCINYLKAYKDICPPLYTCDNNERLWGSKIEELVIHAPEDLRSLDPDVPIFICNMYYDEIRQQLKDMNLPNRIEIFSDEWMDA